MLVCIVVCFESVFACIMIQYVCYTNTIHINTCWYVLAIVIHTFPPYWARIVVCIVVCIKSVFAHIIIQNVHNTHTIHIQYIPVSMG